MFIFRRIRVRVIRLVMMGLRHVYEARVLRMDKNELL
jgi:hypothetical protein